MSPRNNYAIIKKRTVRTYIPILGIIHHVFNQNLGYQKTINICLHEHPHETFTRKILTSIRKGSPCKHNGEPNFTNPRSDGSVAGLPDFPEGDGVVLHQEQQAAHASEHKCHKSALLEVGRPDAESYLHQCFQPHEDEHGEKRKHEEVLHGETPHAAKQGVIPRLQRDD